MSENTPTAKGPAPVQGTPEAKWVTVHAGLKTAEVADLELAPVSKVDPEEIGALSLRYEGEQPVIVTTGGAYIPAELALVHQGTNAAASYLAAPGSAPAARSVEDLLLLNVTPEALGLETMGGVVTMLIERSAAIGVRPEAMGALSLRYMDGAPQLVVSGGTALPAWLPVVDRTGNAVAAYMAGPVSTARSGDPSFVLHIYDQHVLV
ncbi:hypothetical protein ACFYZT_32080 [Streptomyces sp. NPDC001591]|uniref:hypothetical protein n=1 Tax=Streptomyces sp. NPDC001591 TaxID=3364589 RepID=UPI0036CFC694